MVMSDTPASNGLIQNIIAITPRIVSTELSSWLKPCWRVVVTLSMSLVTRLRMSPWECRSKYRNGSRASLDSTSSRMRYTVRCATPAIT